LLKTKFENFSVYNLSIEYPAACHVEFNSKNRRECGDIVFHFPDRERVFVSWGELEKAQKRFQEVEEEAEYSIGALKKKRYVKRLVKLSSDTLSLNSHKGAYNRVKMENMRPRFLPGKKVASSELYSVHLHCEKSSRYFVIHTDALSTDASKDFGEVFDAMLKSFRCH
jgi:hypothetical protein